MAPTEVLHPQLLADALAQIHSSYSPGMGGGMGMGGMGMMGGGLSDYGGMAGEGIPKGLQTVAGG